MRRVILSVFALTITVSLLSQVGINTNTPYTNSVFHIDAKGNNTSATTVTAAQAADDIMINSSGNMGIGTVNPTAKVHIDSSTGTLKPIRLADGSQGVNKYFFSDADGKGTWQDKPMPNGIVYYSNSAKTYPYNVYTELPVEINSAGYSRITIPRQGNYVVTLRWWGAASGLADGTKIMAAANIRLCRYITASSFSVLDQTTFYMPVIGSSASGTRFSFMVSFFASNLAANSILYLQIAPANSGYTWVTGANLTPVQATQTIYYPSVMVYNI